MNKTIHITQERSKKIRGKSIESLFRTLSKNNYRLQQMIDRKANILVSVNTIILTLILSFKYSDLHLTIPGISIYILFSTCLASMLLALMSVRPFVVSTKSLKMRKNNLVNIAVIQQLSISDYKIKMNEILKLDDLVYDAMTEDIFFIGKNIQRKHWLLQLSATVFVLGLIITSTFLLIH